MQPSEALYPPFRRQRFRRGALGRGLGRRRGRGARSTRTIYAYLDTGLYTRVYTESF